jgi:hypothetical protein
MNLDDVLASWQAQDEAPLYRVNGELLQQSLRQELAVMQRGLVTEARVTYGMSALMFAGMATLFLIMLYDNDPRTWWDFVIAILGAATFALWGAHLYIGRRMLALRQRRFGASVRDDIARQITLLNYQIGRTWRPGGIVLSALPLSVGTIALILAAWRVNNEPFSWWVQGGGVLFVVASSVWGHWVGRRKAERELLPRKRRLEALRQELDAHS